MVKRDSWIFKSLKLKLVVTKNWFNNSPKQKLRFKLLVHSKQCNLTLWSLKPDKFSTKQLTLQLELFQLRLLWWTQWWLLRTKWWSSNNKWFSDNNKHKCMLWELDKWDSQYQWWVLQWWYQECQLQVCLWCQDLWCLRQWCNQVWLDRSDSLWWCNQVWLDQWVNQWWCNQEWCQCNQEWWDQWVNQWQCNQECQCQCSQEWCNQEAWWWLLQDESRRERQTRCTWYKKCEWTCQTWIKL